MALWTMGGSMLLFAFATRSGALVSVAWISGAARMVAREDSACVSELRFTVSNAVYAAPRSLALYPWAHVAEAHRETTLLASSCGPCACAHSWSVTQEEDGAALLFLEARGDSVVAVFTKAGSQYGVSLTRVTSDGSVSTWSEAVVCKYVRRRIDALSSEDLEKYLSAVEVIHRTSSLAEGKKLYGEKFANAKWFTAMHLSRATIDDCTPYHGSLSFLPSHEAFASRFDEVLWSIDPSIAQPYWDTSKDDLDWGHKWTSTNNSIWRHFGRSSFDALDDAASEDDSAAAMLRSRTSVSETRFVDVGRFAFLPIATDFSLAEHNAFGRQTMVWNEDDAPFVTRSFEFCGLRTEARLPGCAAMRGVLNQSSLLDFQRKLETDVHGTLHPFAGGAWACGATSFAAQVAAHPEWAQLLTFAGTLLPTAWDVSFLMKQLGTDIPGGYQGLQCPQRCAGNQTFESCACWTSYVDDHLQQGTLNYSVAYDWLQGYLMMLERFEASPRGDVYMEVDESGTFLWRTGRDADGGRLLTDAEQANFTVWLARAVAHPGKVSSYATPLAATNDPLFWPSHLGVTRLWHALRLRRATPEHDATDPFFDWDWGPSTETHPTVFNRSSTCYGRNGDDVLPFRNFMNEQKRSSSSSAAQTLRDPPQEDETELRDARRQTTTTAITARYVDDALDLIDVDDESFDYQSWVAQRKQIKTLLDQGWSMKADSKYYSVKELVDFYEPTNPKLQHIYDDLDWAYCPDA